MLTVVILRHRKLNMITWSADCICKQWAVSACLKVCIMVFICFTEMAVMVVMSVMWQCKETLVPFSPLLGEKADWIDQRCSNVLSPLFALSGCMFVSHNVSLAKADRDVVWAVESWGPRNHVLDGGPGSPPTERGIQYAPQFWGLA